MLLQACSQGKQASAGLQSAVDPLTIGERVRSFSFLSFKSRAGRRFGVSLEPVWNALCRGQIFLRAAIRVRVRSNN
jgi:hypothetical protein